jgi:hypothetical protein
MPRKKSNEAHSSQSLRRVCDHIDALLATPRRVADEMHDAGIQSLSIDYQCSLQSAMKALTLWSHGCEGALTAELTRRGAFKAPAAGKTTGKAARKGG